MSVWLLRSLRPSGALFRCQGQSQATSYEYEDNVSVSPMTLKPGAEAKQVPYDGLCQGTKALKHAPHP